MYTPLNIESRSTIGWAPSLGYLLTIVGGLAIAAVGCREHDSSTDFGGVRATAGEQKVPAASNGTRDETQADVVSPSTLPPAEAKTETTTSTPATTATPPVASSAQADTVLKAAPLTVKRFVVAPGVTDREPLSSGPTLPLGEPVYAFAELSSGAGAATLVEIVFEHESGQKVGYVRLDIPSDMARWRTWGQSRNLKKPGRWTAVLLDAEQTELARVAFDVAAPSVAITAETMQGG